MARKEQENNREQRKSLISAAIRANKEIAELPKNDAWKTDGDYCEKLMGHVVSICERYGMLPTMAMLASALGVPKDIVDDVRNRYIMANPDVVNVIASYYNLCENVTVTSTLDGGTNNIAGIFILKSQYGYKEEPREVIMTHNKLLGDRKDIHSIAQRYMDAVVVDGKELKAIEEKTDEPDTAGSTEEPEYDF